MLSRENKKVCWDCGGEAPSSSAECPFCGGSFSANEEKANGQKSTNFYETSEIPQSPYSTSASYEMLESERPVEKKSLEAEEKERQSVIALSFLLPGITLLILGMGIFFFSEEGYLTLQWKSSYAFFIFLVSAIFIYLGTKNYRKL